MKGKKASLNPHTPISLKVRKSERVSVSGREAGERERERVCVCICPSGWGRKERVR